MTACLLVALCTASLTNAPARVAATAPLDAISSIVNAFRQHAIVALDEEHGDARSSAFRLALMRDPRFAASVDDVVVEFGNAHYQDVIDRFVNGDTVSYEVLRRVWQDTTIPQAIWDRPIYEEFFRTVREINAQLPRDRRLRVLLGDPPFEWSAIHSTADHQKVRSIRGRHPADIVLREVLAKKRRALVIYGALHLLRQNPAGPNLIEHVEKDGGTTAFVVVTHPFVSIEALGVTPGSLPVPSVALTGGSSLANQLDAVLYLGPGSGRSPSRLAPSLCEDPAYREMRRSRMALAGETAAAVGFAKECGVVQGKPDFSGSWTPDPMPPPIAFDGKGIPPPPPVVGLTITHTDASMKIDRRVDTSGRVTISSLTYKLDGAESVNQTGPLVHRTTAAWEGSTLVLSSKISVDEKQVGTFREVFRLDGVQLIIETTRQTPAGTFNDKIVHKKQPPSP